MPNRLKILLVLLVGLFLVAGCGQTSAHTQLLPGLEYPDGRPVALKNNPAAVNVIYRELVTFLDSYQWQPAACLKLSVDLHDAAEAYGIRAGILIMMLMAGSHAIVVFETADRGLVFVDLFYGKEPVDLTTMVERYGHIGGVYEFW
jgi:hypothetical protein